MSANEFIDQDELAAQKAAEEKKQKKRKNPKRKSAKASSEQDSRRVILQLMNGEFLAKDNFVSNLPFSFFLAFLLVVMIGWGYYAEAVTKQEVRLGKELDELDSEYSTLDTKFNSRGDRSTAEAMLKGTGVKPNSSGSKKIHVSKYKFE